MALPPTPGCNAEVFVVMHHMEAYNTSIPVPWHLCNVARPLHVFDTRIRAEQYATRYAQSRQFRFGVEEQDFDRRELHDRNNATLGWGYEISLKGDYDGHGNRTITGRELVYVDRQWMDIDLKSCWRSSVMDAERNRPYRAPRSSPYYV